MKRNQSNLDEMQELKLLKIEHTGCWLALWGLVAAILVQTALGNDGMQNLLGEQILLIVLSLYLATACIKNGIWDRKLKPTFKTNLLLSLGTGFGMGAFWGVVSYFRYRALIGSLATFVFILFFVSILVFLCLLAASSLYKKRQEQLDAAGEENQD